MLVVCRPDGEVVVPDGPKGLRRSIHLQIRRSQTLAILQLFDQPVIETNCTRRAASTVSSQALTPLNGDFLDTQAAAFADRVLRESPNDPTGYAVRLAFGRPATNAERTLFYAYLNEQAGRGQRAAQANV